MSLYQYKLRTHTFSTSVQVKDLQVPNSVQVENLQVFHSVKIENLQFLTQYKLRTNKFQLPASWDYTIPHLVQFEDWQVFNFIL